MKDLDYPKLVELIQAEMNKFLLPQTSDQMEATLKEIMRLQELKRKLLKNN